MFYISDFCHICFKYENSLINLSQKEPENAEIVSKLMLCVSEVEWALNKNFCMCDICLQRLNSAYDFKQQCIKSIETLSKYLLEQQATSESDLVKGKSGTSPQTKEDICKELLSKCIDTLESEPQRSTVNIVVPSTQQNLGLAEQNAASTQQSFPAEQNFPPPPDQNLPTSEPNAQQGPPSEQKILTPLTKLIVTNTSQGPFQNIFLNLIPTSMLNLNSLTTSTGLRDGAQNMIIFPAFQTRSVLNNNDGEINVSHLLENSKSEELSIEVDPTVFDYTSEAESDNEKDWDEVISCNKIGADLDGGADSSEKNSNVPILPPVNNVYNSEITNEEKMEFFNFGHFLTNPRIKSYNMNMQCDICSQCFDTIRSLRNHIKVSHDSNFPYKCSLCLADFALLSHYESHMEKHTSDTLLGNSITLDNIKQQSSESFIHVENYECHSSSGNGKEYKCDLCGRKFTTSQGLIRHKVRRHDEQKSRTKYFVKGMKNAKCDICNRSFSTQSYLQLHLKLHNRKGEWKRKIYNKEEKVEEDAPPTQEEMKESTPHQEEAKLTEEEEEEPEKKEDEMTDHEEDMASDLNESTPIAITEENTSSPPEEENRSSIKIKINLKDIIRVQEDFSKPVQANSEDMMDVASDKYSTDENGEYNIVEHFKFANFEDFSIHDESKLDTICFSEENIQLQSQNASVFKFEWVNGKPKCVYCQKMFGRKHDLKRHINNVHMKSIQYKCHICKRKFYEGFHLTRHLRGHYSSLACPQCNKKFCTITDIKNHLMVSHDGIGNVDCGVCNISFDDLMILKDHIEEHLKTIIYKCHICNDEYKECRDLTKHIVEHSGVYTCSQCNRNFCTEKELLSHLRIHSSEVSMRHRCEICQNTFKKKRYLYSHLKNCHSIEKQDAEILIDTVVLDPSNIPCTAVSALFGASSAMLGRKAQDVACLAFLRI